LRIFREDESVFVGSTMTSQSTRVLRSAWVSIIMVTSKRRMTVFLHIELGYIKLSQCDPLLSPRLSNLSKFDTQRWSKLITCAFLFTITVVSSHLLRDR